MTKEIERRVNNLNAQIITLVKKVSDIERDVNDMKGKSMEKKEYITTVVPSVPSVHPDDDD